MLMVTGFSTSKPTASGRATLTGSAVPASRFCDLQERRSGPGSARVPRAETCLATRWGLATGSCRCRQVSIVCGSAKPAHYACCGRSRIRRAGRARSQGGWCTVMAPAGQAKATASSRGRLLGFTVVVMFLGKLADQRRRLMQVLSAQRNELELELARAAEVQQRLLPQEAPNIPGTDIAGLMSPSKELGGDYYDYIELPHGNLGLVIADVSGKGAEAALFMPSIEVAFRSGKRQRRDVFRRKTRQRCPCQSGEHRPRIGSNNPILRVCLRRHSGTAR